MRNTVRNILIFTLVAWGGGFLGIALDRFDPPVDPMQGVGALLWLLSPVIAHLLLRLFGGDGWRDLGLRPQFKTSWGWYLAAVLIVLAVVLVPLVLGQTVGVIVIAGFRTNGVSALLALAGTGFAGAMVKNIFEELAWRGYLTPRFAALNLHPCMSALLTGIIWAGWHIPYYLYFFDANLLRQYTPLSMPLFILSAFLLLPFHALAYGELRLLSRSIWPGWLLHNLANAITFALISGGFINLSGYLSAVFWSPGTDGVLHALLMGLIGLALYQYRKSNSKPFTH